MTSKELDLRVDRLRLRSKRINWQLNISILLFVIFTAFRYWLNCPTKNQEIIETIVIVLLVIFQTTNIVRILLMMRDWCRFERQRLEVLHFLEEPGIPPYISHLSTEWWIAHNIVKIADRKNSSLLSQEPPRFASFLLLFVPDRDREALFGDMEEKYWMRYLPEHGLRKARWVYRWQVGVTIFDFLWAKAMRVLGLILIFRRR